MNSKATTSEVTELAAVEAPSAGKLLKRTEAARLLGVSVSTLRRREGDLLNPIVGPDGVHLFQEAEVRSVMVTLRSRATLAALGPSAGDTAADVFTLLDEGEHPVEIVKRLHLTPDVVTTLHEQWARMRGGFTVSPGDARTLGVLARAGTPSSAAEALRVVRTRTERLTNMRRGSARCHACRDHVASFCEPCMVRTRGPLSSVDLRVESRTNDIGVEELRVAFGVYWDDVGSDGGSVAPMSSEWVAASDIDESPICELVDHIRRLRG